ncbi:MAG: helix-turn-helix domain-containing protein [Campylobacterota bacterium]|nr:helix-turn-helix domain-containing protein [Campylobacterota bacterium]
MKNITNFTPKTIEKLQEIIKSEPKYRPRKRAEAILLSNKGKSVKEIVDILEIKKQALYEWFKKYEKDGINELYDKPGKGRKLALRGMS